MMNAPLLSVYESFCFRIRIVISDQPQPFLRRPSLRPPYRGVYNRENNANNVAIKSKLKTYTRTTLSKKAKKKETMTSLKVDRIEFGELLTILLQVIYYFIYTLKTVFDSFETLSQRNDIFSYFKGFSLAFNNVQH